MISMNKTELTAAMAETSGLSKKDCEAALAAFTGAVETAMKSGDKVSKSSVRLERIAEGVRAMKSGDKVQMVGFGSFEVKKRPARVGRNPRTGEPMTYPACKVPVFKPGKALKDAIR
jgi:DNA-binding protein HU-beta